MQNGVFVASTFEFKYSLDKSWYLERFTTNLSDNTHCHYYKNGHLKYIFIIPHNIVVTY